MPAQIYYSPFIPAFSSNGLPSPGAKLFFFYSGTNTLAPIYTSDSLAVRSVNPVVSDLAARFDNIYLDSSIVYRVRLMDADGNQLGQDIDPYTPGQAVTIVPSLPQLLAPDGATKVGYGTTTVKGVLDTQSTKLSKIKNVTDPEYGAKGDGSTDDTAAINSALSGGGKVVFPGPATYKITNRLLVTSPRTEIVLEAGVTLIGNPWRYPGGQLPFGSFILITAANCSVSGAGTGTSVIQLTGGSEANGITFLHTDGGSVSDLTLDGGMSGVVAVEDDTFMTGINVLNASVSRPAGTKWSRVAISRVEVRNWAQYGLQSYGDLSGADFDSCWVHNNGIANQATSRGAGIAITRGNQKVNVNNCVIEDNKQDGIFQTSAGLASKNLSFTNNLIQRNGRWGMTCTEEANYASVANQGTNGITSSGNTVRENGGGLYPSTGGIRAGTYDNVGPLLNFSSTGDVIQDNYGYGFLAQTNASSNRLMYMTIDSRIIGSSGPGLGIGASMDDSVRWNGTKIRNNVGVDIDNSGDSRLVSNSRGYGGSISSASTITIPRDGDSFTLTGTTTINNITPDEGRVVTLVFGGNITISKTGNITMANDFVGTGNATIQLVSRQSGWLAVSRTANV